MKHSKKRNREKENIFTVLPVDVGFLLASKKRYILILEKKREQEVPSSLPLFCREAKSCIECRLEIERKSSDRIFSPSLLEFLPEVLCLCLFLDRLRQRNCFLSRNEILGPDRHLTMQLQQNALFLRVLHLHSTSYSISWWERRGERREERAFHSSGHIHETHLPLELFSLILPLSLMKRKETEKTCRPNLIRLRKERGNRVEDSFGEEKGVRH